MGGERKNEKFENSVIHEINKIYPRNKITMTKTFVAEPSHQIPAKVIKRHCYENNEIMKEKVDPNLNTL